MPHPSPSPFDHLDTAAVARTLSQIAEREEDLADALFERLEEVELPAEGASPGFRVRREEGLAVRLVRGPESWLAARDSLEPRDFSDALRQVARALPAAAYPEPRLAVQPWPEAPGAGALAEVPLAVGRAIRARHTAFPLHLTVRRHHREIQVVGPTLVPAAERESFYSLAAELPWGRWGMLAPSLDELGALADRAAESLVERFRCRQAPAPAARRTPVVLGPHAAAVFLHEAVAHALEADTLGLTGRPEDAVGLQMGPAGFHVLDDPGSAPEPVRRTTDDEGASVLRRWLIRDGAVEQPLADRLWCRGSDELAPGAGRRASRHEPPGPRSTHLELLPGETGEDDLLDGAEGGLWIAEADRGRLDPLSGRFILEAPCGRRIRSGGRADPVGRFRLEGAVADLVERVAAVGSEPLATGAGWCAKGGRRLPVWATAPALLLESVEVAP
ncbi:MAG: metallopeptidase TldD-related protein [Acidobacteriota bacterium]